VANWHQWQKDSSWHSVNKRSLPGKLPAWYMTGSAAIGNVYNWLVATTLLPAIQ
jgi:hypothetical protein